MRLLLIVNPTASSVTPGVQAEIVGALATRHDLEVAQTSARNHASQLAHNAASAGFDVVVVLAGDGTLNEATQGLAGTMTALAPLPGGSTNVFARTLGIAFEPLDACAQLLRSLEVDSRRRIGLGVAVNGGSPRRFAFHLGVGFDAAVVRQMEERHSRLKRRLAHPAFAVATLDTWLRHYDRSMPITVTAIGAAIGADGSDPTVDGRIGATRAATGPYAVVSNSGPYTYVGRRPVTIAPDADLDRALAVTVFSSLRVGLVARAVASGLTRPDFFAASPEISQFADVYGATVSADRPFPWQVDGDHLGSTTELTVSYEPDALTLIVP